MDRPPLIPDEFRYLHVWGVQYYIAWEELHPGCSFFMKTPASARTVQKELTRVSRYLNMTLKAVTRVEFGYHGVRVWRL
jgi:hypothetical protein